MKFTIEKENELRSISFLDVLVKVEHKQQPIGTNFVRESTIFYIILSQLQKIFVIFNMIDIVVNLSVSKYLNQNIAIIQETLQNNHYPLQLINTYIDTENQLT